MVGVDANPRAINICKKKTAFKYGKSKIEIREADARKLSFIKNGSIDFICTHPPYADIIKYSNDIESDISLLDYTGFLDVIVQVTKESFRVLKKGKYCAYVVVYIRQKKFSKNARI